MAPEALGELIVSLTAQRPELVPCFEQWWLAENAYREKGWAECLHAWKHTCVGVQAHVHISLGFLLLSSCLCLNVYLCHSNMTCREKQKSWDCEEEKAV